MASSSVRVRETMGPNQFAKRREVFDKYDSVFTPQDNIQLRHSESSYGKPVILSNQGNLNFQRNVASYLSFREPRSDMTDFRQRKWSDIQNPISIDESITIREKNYGDMPRSHSSSDYSQILRRQRLSKLRAEFLASNLHDPEEISQPFKRYETRASLPAQKIRHYQGVSHIYKFPFAEPYSTPPTIRKVHLDFGTPVIKADSKPPIDNQNESVEAPNDGNISQDLEKASEELYNTSTVDSVDVTQDTVCIKEEDADVSEETAKRSNDERLSGLKAKPALNNDNFKERFEKLRNEYAPHVAPTNILELLPPTKPRIANVVLKEHSSDNSEADHASNNEILVTQSKLPDVTENTDGLTSQTDSGKSVPVNNVASHQRSPSDFTQESRTPTQPMRRNTEDSSNKPVTFTKTKKRNFFQRLFLKSKKDK